MSVDEIWGDLVLLVCWGFIFENNNLIVIIFNYDDLIVIWFLFIYKYIGKD